MKGCLPSASEKRCFNKTVARLLAATKRMITGDTEAGASACCFTALSCERACSQRVFLAAALHRDVIEKCPSKHASLNAVSVFNAL